MDLRRPLMSNPVTDSATVVIFGASGDLTRRKLLPAIHNLAQAGLLPESFAIIGIARPPLDDAGFRSQMRSHAAGAGTVASDSAAWQWLEPRLHYLSGEFADAALYRRLGSKLDDVQNRWGVAPNSLFYLATPPGLFAPVSRACRRGAHSRGPGLAARRRREAVRTRSRIGPRSERPTHHRSGRVAGVPDRSLPREGDRPEHPRAPLRQWHLRADVEPGAMTGDQTLFHRMDIVEAGWVIVEPLLRAWSDDTGTPVYTYERGSWGPPEADLLLEHEERQWRC